MSGFMGFRSRRFIALLMVLISVLSCGTGCLHGKYPPGMSDKNMFALSTVQNADIYVDAVSGITEGFIKGVDISTILAEEASGVKYYDGQGSEQDIFDLLADAGIDYIRVRVWNDPYDSEGHGFGGGNCDTENAVIIGKRAAEHGMKLLVDYHYSDFWADPKKQFCPRGWEDMQIWDKSEACYKFTLDSINRIMDGGADVGMVQLGNEINKGMSGERQYSFISELIKAGAKAVREAAEAHKKDVEIAVHLANPEDPDTILDRLTRLKNNEVEYDIVGLSYYPYWHGTLENLTQLMTKIREDYGKDTMVLETSYAYTLEDGDGSANSVSEKDLNKDYAATVQSQVNALRDVCQAVVNAHGRGVFYWEPAWIPVNHYDPAAADSESVLAKNRELWEKYGSGWASSYAAEYDPGDAGKYYGGSAWDNQAWFDFDGKALPSLYSFKYLMYGANCDLKADYAEEALVSVVPGEAVKMPANVEVHYNDRSKNGLWAAVWDEKDVAAIDTSRVGEYHVRGKLSDGFPVSCIVKVEYANLVTNPSFEDTDRSMYIIDGDCVDYQQKETDSSTGEWAMHYWSSGKVKFTAEQTLTGLKDGSYSFSIKTQGGDAGDSPVMFIFAKSGDREYRTDFNVAGWVVWQDPVIENIEVTGGEITVGVCVDAPAGAWGTIDDFYVCRTN